MRIELKMNFKMIYSKGKYVYIYFIDKASIQETIQKESKKKTNKDDGNGNGNGKDSLKRNNTEKSINNKKIQGFNHLLFNDHNSSTEDLVYLKGIMDEAMLLIYNFSNQNSHELFQYYIEVKLDNFYRLFYFLIVSPTCHKVIENIINETKLQYLGKRVLSEEFLENNMENIILTNLKLKMITSNYSISKDYFLLEKIEEKDGYEYFTFFKIDSLDFEIVNSIDYLESHKSNRMHCDKINNLLNQFPEIFKNLSSNVNQNTIKKTNQSCKKSNLKNKTSIKGGNIYDKYNIKECINEDLIKEDGTDNVSENSIEKFRGKDQEDNMNNLNEDEVNNNQIDLDNNIHNTSNLSNSIFSGKDISEDEKHENLENNDILNEILEMDINSVNTERCNNGTPFPNLLKKIDHNLLKPVNLNEVFTDNVTNNNNNQSNKKAKYSSPISNFNKDYNSNSNSKVMNNLDNNKNSKVIEEKENYFQNMNKTFENICNINEKNTSNSNEEIIKSIENNQPKISKFFATTKISNFNEKKGEKHKVKQFDKEIKEKLYPNINVGTNLQKFEEKVSNISENQIFSVTDTRNNQISSKNKSKTNEINSKNQNSTKQIIEENDKKEADESDREDIGISRHVVDSKTLYKKEKKPRQSDAYNESIKNFFKKYEIEFQEYCKDKPNQIYFKYYEVKVIASFGVVKFKFLKYMQLSSYELSSEKRKTIKKNDNKNNKISINEEHEISQYSNPQINIDANNTNINNDENPNLNESLNESQTDNIRVNDSIILTRQMKISLENSENELRNNKPKKKVSFLPQDNPRLVASNSNNDFQSNLIDQSNSTTTQSQNCEDSINKDSNVNLNHYQNGNENINLNKNDDINFVYKEKNYIIFLFPDVTYVNSNTKKEDFDLLTNSNDNFNKVNNNKLHNKFYDFKYLDDISKSITKSFMYYNQIINKQDYHDFILSNRIIYNEPVEIKMKSSVYIPICILNILKIFDSSFSEINSCNNNNIHTSSAVKEKNTQSQKTINFPIKMSQNNTLVVNDINNINNQTDYNFNTNTFSNLSISNLIYEQYDMMYVDANISSLSDEESDLFFSIYEDMEKLLINVKHEYENTIKSKINNSVNINNEQYNENRCNNSSICSDSLNLSNSIPNIFMTLKDFLFEKEIIDYLFKKSISKQVRKEISVYAYHGNKHSYVCYDKNKTKNKKKRKGSTSSNSSNDSKINCENANDTSEIDIIKNSQIEIINEAQDSNLSKKINFEFSDNTINNSYICNYCKKCFSNEKDLHNNILVKLYSLAFLKLITEYGIGLEEFYSKNELNEDKQQFILEREYEEYNTDYNNKIDYSKENLKVDINEKNLNNDNNEKIKANQNQLNEEKLLISNNNMEGILHARKILKPFNSEDILLDLSVGDKKIKKLTRATVQMQVLKKIRECNRNNMVEITKEIIEKGNYRRKDQIINFATPLERHLLVSNIAHKKKF